MARVLPVVGAGEGATQMRVDIDAQADVAEAPWARAQLENAVRCTRPARARVAPRSGRSRSHLLLQVPPHSPVR